MNFCKLRVNSCFAELFTTWTWRKGIAAYVRKERLWGPSGILHSELVSGVSPTLERSPWESLKTPRGGASFTGALCEVKIGSYPNSPQGRWDGGSMNNTATGARLRDFRKERERNEDTRETLIITKGKRKLAGHSGKNKFKRPRRTWY